MLNMNEMGFVPLHPDVLGVFVNNDPVGMIKKVNDVLMFIQTKERKPMTADALRAVAVKIEMMEAWREGNKRHVGIAK